MEQIQKTKEAAQSNAGFAILCDAINYPFLEKARYYFSTYEDYDQCGKTIPCIRLEISEISFRSGVTIPAEFKDSDTESVLYNEYNDALAVEVLHGFYEALNKTLPL